MTNDDTLDPEQNARALAMGLAATQLKNAMVRPSGLLNSFSSDPEQVARAIVLIADWIMTGQQWATLETYDDEATERNLALVRDARNEAAHRGVDDEEGQ